MTESKQGNSTSKQGLVCSFCGKAEQEVEKIIIVGKLKKPICDQCISICNDILGDAELDPNAG